MVNVVIDSSALVETFTGRSPHPDLIRRSLTSSLVAPELLDCEVLSTLRKLERAGLLTQDQVRTAVAKLTEVPIVRVTHRPLIARTWQLRQSVSVYDGAYVALAEQLGIPLVTCDARLAKSHGHDARIELYEGS